MNDQEMIEFANWIAADTAKQMLSALMIYTAALSAYWIFVG